MNLCVIILTNTLNKDIEKPKVMPKVCYKIGGKSMLEICLDNVTRLNPNRIILMTSKYEILHINKLIKHATYSKLISFCIFNNEKNSNIGVFLAKKCYENQNVLVVPGNAPLLSTKSMYKIISQKRNIKINDSLFFLKKENLDEIEGISNYSTGDEEFLSKKEILQVETRGQFNDMNVLFEKKSKKFRKFLEKKK